MSLFGNIANTSGTQNSGYFEEGIYKVEIQRMVLADARKGGSYIAIECRVLESSNPTIPVGGTRSQIISTRWVDTWERHLRNFLEASFLDRGLDLSEITAAATEAIFEGDGTRIAGQVLDLEVSKTTSKKGNDFSVHKWTAPGGLAIASNPFAA